MACSWDSTTSAGPEGPNLLRHTGGLHHAAVRGEVATQHGQTAFGDGRMIDVVNRAVHTVAVEGVEQRGMRPRIRGHDVTRGRQIHLLGFLGAGITHDVPVVEFVLKRLVIDGMHVAVQLAGTVELAENASDATGAMHVGDLPFAGRRSLADAGHGVGDALDVVKREVHVGGLRHGEDMQHCIGGATHGHIHGHGVLERFLGGDGTREHSLVIIVVILLGDLDDLLGGALEQILAVGVRSQNGAIAWQGQADGLGQAVHRIRGEHAGAGTTGRADGLLIGEQILFVQIVVGGGIHHVDQIGVLLHGSVGKYRGAGLHRTAGDEDGRDVQTQSGHQHARHDLVTVRDADQGVGTVRVHLIFHGVGDDVTARQGVQHAGVSHGDAVVNGHRVELTRNAASFLDGLGDQSTNLVQVHVAGQELIEGIGNGDDRLAEILTVHASGTVEGACAREYSSIHQFCRSHFHVLYCGG